MAFEMPSGREIQREVTFLDAPIPLLASDDEIAIDTGRLDAQHPVLDDDQGEGAGHFDGVPVDALDERVGRDVTTPVFCAANESVNSFMTASIPSKIVG